METLGTPLARNAPNWNRFYVRFLFLLSLSLFTACGGGQDATQHDIEEDVVSIPIRVTEDRIYVSVRVNGIDCECLLDTGAPVMFVGNVVANDVGAEVVYESFDEANNTLYRFDEVSFGPFYWQDAEFWGSDRWYECLVGLEPLKDYEVTINFKEQVLELRR